MHHSVWDDWEKIKVNELVRHRYRKEEFLAVGEACKAMFRPTSGLTEGSFDKSGFSAKGT